MSGFSRNKFFFLVALASRDCICNFLMGFMPTTVTCVHVCQFRFEISICKASETSRALDPAQKEEKFAQRIISFIKLIREKNINPNAFLDSFTDFPMTHTTKFSRTYQGFYSAPSVCTKNGISDDEKQPIRATVVK